MSHTSDDVLGSRKADHIDLCNDRDVEARSRSTLFEHVHLLHDSLPELDVEEIDLSTSIAGLPLRAPLMISGMTGGIERARILNETLAVVAQEFGFAFGVGSQRAMMRDPSITSSYAVRSMAPDVVLMGNIGAVQAAESSIQELEDLVGAIDANALCIHLNPGQEIIQEHGDRDFRGCLAGIERAADELSVPVIAKETGCGLGPSALERLRDVGVRTVDVSGLGGTTWVGVETLRSRGVREAVGDALWDWGIPTAAAVHYAADRGLEVIASGGIRSGADAAKAVALGANVASCALPWLRAVQSGGLDGARQVARVFVETLRAICLLTGSPNIAALREAPRVVGPPLERWMHQSFPAP